MLISKLSDLKDYNQPHVPGYYFRIVCFSKNLVILSHYGLLTSHVNTWHLCLSAFIDYRSAFCCVFVSVKPQWCL